MTKKELRAIYLQKRFSFSESDLADLNQRLCSNFLKHINLHDVNILHTFLPLKQKKEPNTWLIIDAVKKTFPKIRISIPKITAEGKLENYYFESSDQLTPSALGIPEPNSGEQTAAHVIDLVIVPLLAYDKQGQRVGYGKGYYDRFLKICKPGCRKIGLSFFSAEEKIDDIFEGDEPLDDVVTPDQFYHFS
jgi:5-formyltetrahydrofolate cyclo-ligase